MSYHSNHVKQSTFHILPLLDPFSMIHDVNQPHAADVPILVLW
jgi:hypothetical protein